MAKYRTIVADPPWPMGKMNSWGGDRGFGQPRDLGAKLLPYETQDVEWIKSLRVKDLADEAAHLYLWTTNRFLEDSYAVARAWGFEPSTMLVWAKNPMGAGLGGEFGITTEFVLFARRGTSLGPSGLEQRVNDLRPDSTWFNWKRPYSSEGKPLHSAKPDGFLDMVERVSFPPYLELFARRARFGWDYWGDESLGTAEVAA